MKETQVRSHGSSYFLLCKIENCNPFKKFKSIKSRYITNKCSYDEFARFKHIEEATVSSFSLPSHPSFNKLNFVPVVAPEFGAK